VGAVDVVGELATLVDGDVLAGTRTSRQAT
jgi:hypothetical protein